MGVLDKLYRVLGIVAATNHALWLFRINFIPLNVGLIALLGFGAYQGYEQLQDARSNQSSPVSQSISALFTHREQPRQEYVSVAGVLFTKARVEYGKTGPGGQITRVDKAWAPLVDRESRQALFVELSRERIRDDEPADVVIEGMLRQLNDDLRKEVASEGYLIGGLPVHQTYMLVEGERPSTLRSGLLIAGSCGVLLLMFGFAIANRNVMFLPSNVSVSAGPQVEGASLYVSGKLYLSEQVSQRFCNVPAGVRMSATGDMAVVSNIDASSRFMGIKTTDRSGLWALTIRRGSVTDVRRGYIYTGLKRLPAVRFQFVSAADGASEWAVLAATGGDPLSVVQA